MLRFETVALRWIVEAGWTSLNVHGLAELDEGRVLDHFGQRRVRLDRERCPRLSRRTPLLTPLRVS